MAKIINPVGVLKYAFNLNFTVTEAYLHHGKIVKITKEVEDEPGKHKKGYQNTFLSLFWLSVVIKKSI